MFVYSCLVRHRQPFARIQPSVSARLHSIWMREWVLYQWTNCRKLPRFFRRSHLAKVFLFYGTSTPLSCTSISLSSMQTQQRVLASAFLRSLKDPFPPSRTAGLNGLAVTSSYYTPQDVANKILPALSPTLVDPEKTVREKVCGITLVVMLTTAPSEVAFLL